MESIEHLNGHHFVLTVELQPRAAWRAAIAIHRSRQTPCPDFA
jgi:hypothetical protein